MASPAEPTTVERILEQQGRTMAWLARKASSPTTSFSVSYVWRMLHGERPLTPEFRAAAADALGVPEDIVFPVVEAEGAA